MKIAACILMGLLGCAGATPPPTRPEVPKPAQATGDAGTIDFQLRPRCGSGGEPTGLDVEVSVEAWSDEPLVFRIADPEGSSHPKRELIVGPRLTDARGDIPLTATEEPDPGDGARRFFLKGQRPAEGRATLRYHARSIPTSEEGPRFGLRHDENGIGGTADGFLVAPSLGDARPLRVRWANTSCKKDLLPIGALGPGPEPSVVVAPPDALRQAGFYLARSETRVHQEGTMKLSFSFIGRPAFDTGQAAKYAADVLRAERAAFGDDDPTPFYAFMRVIPEMTTRVTGGGNAYGYTSVVGPEAAFDTRMRDHIAHELLHHWIGVGLWLTDAEKVNGYWLSEGFTVHYSRMVPLRAGILPPAEMLTQLNTLTTAFETSPHKGASNRALEDAIDRGVGDPAMGLIPYFRGALYAAELDAAIRQASRGARSLDDLMRNLLREARSAPRNAAGYAELPESVFRDQVFGELGRGGAERFDAVIRRGELPRPPGHAFGPCFDRREPEPGRTEWFRVPGVPDARCGEPGQSREARAPAAPPASTSVALK